MNKKLFTFILIILLTVSTQVCKAIETPSLLKALLPGTKNCPFVGESKLYQPFSNIDKTFPGATTLGVTVVQDSNKNDINCIKVDGSTENLLKIIFTSLISIIIVLTVISIAVSGIQFMTEAATGQIKGGAKKRLQNSFIALGLALLSYTIMYTINKQLVEFNFEPSKIDSNGLIDKGIKEAEAAKAKGSVLVADSALEYLTQPLQQNNTNGTNLIPQGSTPSFNETITGGNFSTYASYRSIKCGGTLCSSSKPTVFGYLDGDGTVGRSGDNGIGNSSWSTKPGCTYDNWNTISMGVALPQGFWRAAGIPLSDVKYIGIRVYVNGSFKKILPVVDDSESNLDFTFAAAKAFIDSSITNSNRLNTSGKEVTFEIVRDYYKTNEKTNVVWISNTSTFNNRKPCNI